MPASRVSWLTDNSGPAFGAPWTRPGRGEVTRVPIRVPAVVLDGGNCGGVPSAQLKAWTEDNSSLIATRPVGRSGTAFIAVPSPTEPAEHQSP
jgi:hypothetical protein